MPMMAMSAPQPQLVDPQHPVEPQHLEHQPLAPLEESVAGIEIVEILPLQPATQLHSDVYSASMMPIAVIPHHLATPACSNALAAPMITIALLGSFVEPIRRVKLRSCILRAVVP